MGLDVSELFRLPLAPGVLYAYLDVMWVNIQQWDNYDVHNSKWFGFGNYSKREAPAC